MSPLNLVIHRKDLQKYFMSYIRVPSVLERINEVKKSDPDNTFFVEKRDLRIPEKLCEGYSSVILYGYSRGYCLHIVAEDLMRKVIKVSYDITGSF